MNNPPLTFFLHTTNPALRAVAEKPSTVTTLERLGYTQCDYATYLLDWQAEDRARAIRLFGPAVLVNPYDTGG